MGKLSRRQFATLVSSAAAGLVGGAAILSGCGKEAGPGDAKTGPADQHSCKGMNACKGQGGCKSGDNGCVGKNSCKGKGGCKVPVEQMK
ncbi:MAG TPA: hypothetical protein VKU80_00455 [Planctomycetota bacterium]|nr:hypothetical protein [Planctomycetota bacterium]